MPDLASSSRDFVGGCIAKRENLIYLKAEEYSFKVIWSSIFNFKIYLRVH